jgi:hypothetical protein
MKNKGLFVVVAIVIFGLVSIATVSKRNEVSDQVKLRADEGDLVWIIMNHVKPDKREQFEKFSEIWTQTITDLMDEGKIDEKSTQALKQIRALYPTQANEDGSWTYIFLCDPWIEGVKSSIRYWFNQKYSEEETLKYGKMFSECLMHRQVSYMSTQGEYSLK